MEPQQQSAFLEPQQQSAFLHGSAPVLDRAHEWAGAAAVAVFAPLVLLIAVAIGFSCARRKLAHAAVLPHQRIIDPPFDDDESDQVQI